MTHINPGSPEWDAVRDRIVALEVEATEHTNTARDLLLAQGDEFNRVAPKGATSARNGSKALLDKMAAECGIATTTATNRRDLAVLSADTEVRTILREATDVQVSFETLRTVMADGQPEVLLRSLIRQARKAGATRITRDDVRRERGMVTGTVGTPQATAERMARDPEFRKEVLGSLSPEAVHDLSIDVDHTYANQPHVQRAIKGQQAEESHFEDVNRGLSITERRIKVHLLLVEMANDKDRPGLAAAREEAAGLFDSLGADALTPEQFA